MMDACRAVLAEFTQKRDALNAAIRGLELVIAEYTPTPPPVAASVAVAPPLRAKLVLKAQEPMPKKKPRRTFPTVARRAGGRPRPELACSDADADAIVDQVRRHGPRKPADLMAALDLRKDVLRRRLEILAARGLIELTGKTVSRRVHLPAGQPTRAAKEGL